MKEIIILQEITALERSEDLITPQPENLDNADKLVNVYPNPTKYGIHIAFNDWEQHKKYQLQLVDGNGRILLKKA